LANSKNRTANRRISKHAKISSNAKQSDSKQINSQNSKQQQNSHNQQTAAKIQQSGNNAGRLPAGGIRPRNTHCMIMLPT
jgi:hypothetical protein